MNKLALFLILIAGYSCYGELKDASSVLKKISKIVVADSKRFKGATPFIIGGEVTTIEDHPYQVSFQTDGDYLCGGFIVSEEYIVTAAHCIRTDDMTKIVLRAGSSFWSNGTVIPLSEVWVHPEYNNPRNAKDVAVFKTAEKIEYTDTIKAIPLASEGREIAADSTIVISGWGLIESGGTSLPDQLYSVSTKVVEQEKCEELYPNLLTNNEFCAGDVEQGQQGACHGDSGGAATQDGVAVGIISYAWDCEKPNSPTVFANIAAKSIRDFIKEKTGL